MDLVTVKILVLLASGLVRIFFGIMPLVIMKALAKSWTKKTDRMVKKAISVLMFFGGGVLLATCFLHMMPEVRENFREAEPSVELPLSEIIFVAGFFLVYMIEDIVHSIVHQRKNRKAATKSSGSRNTSSPNSNSNRNNEGNAKKVQRNGSSSNMNGNPPPPSGTLMMVVGEDKGLHNNVETNIKGATTNGTNITDPLSLSVQNERHPNPNLQWTKEIFDPNSKRNGEEIISSVPTRSQCQNGITNEAFEVSEKFQYVDSEWLNEISESRRREEALFRPRGRLSICSEFFPPIPPNMEGRRSPSIFNTYNTYHGSNQPNSGILIMKSENNNIAPSSPLEDQPKKHSHSHAHHRHSHRSNHSHSHMPISSDKDEIDQSIGAEIRNILIVIAISFHAVFEGMAIGLQGKTADVLFLFLAVSLHECTILFCIGVELISSKTKLFRMILYILVVSLVSPVGIAIGIVITEKASGEVIHQALIVGCFQGLAAGTLLYVVFFEIFQEEGKKLHRKCYHILIAILGFVLMGSLEFMGHSHGGGHSHGAGNGSESGQNHSHGTQETNSSSHHSHNHDHGDHNHSHEHEDYAH